MLVRVAGVWLIVATFYLGFDAWAHSFCLFECGYPPPVPVALVPLGIATLALSRTIESIRFLVLPAASSLIAGVALTVLGAWAEIAAMSSDPYGPSLGSYFPGHGSQLAIMSAVMLAIPAAAILMGARGGGRSLPSRVRWPTEVGLIGALAGAVIGTIPGTVPTIESSHRSFASSRHAYTVVVPVGFESSARHCLFLGTCWTLPEEIDWFSDVDEDPSDIQLAVWSTPLSTETTLSTFAAAQQASDGVMGFAATDQPEVAQIAGAQGIRFRYRSQVAPRSRQPVCILGMACDDVAVWSDCRFYLGYVGQDVRAERIIGVVAGRGFVLSAFTSPDAFDDGSRLLAVFAAALRPDRAAMPPSASEMERYPESGPLTADKQDC